MADYYRRTLSDYEPKKYPKGVEEEYAPKIKKAYDAMEDAEMRIYDLELPYTLDRNFQKVYRDGPINEKLVQQAKDEYSALKEKHKKIVKEFESKAINPDGSSTKSNSPPRRTSICFMIRL